MTSEQELKDIDLLMESLKGYNKTPSEAEDCLNTLGTVLSSSGVAKEHFQKSGGLSVVFSLIKNADDDKLKQKCLYTLATAVDGNKTSQEIITTKEIYTMVKAFVKAKKVTLSSTASYLLLCLSSGNRKGQDLARETRCIHTLCDVIRQCIPPINENSYRDSGEQWFESLEGISVGQCVVACNALHVLQTNPQNAENQRICSQLLVPCTKILRSTAREQHELLEAVILLMSTCVTGSSEMQSKLRLTGGLRALNDLLEDCMLMVEDQEKGVELSLLQQLICTLGCAITGHAANQEAAVDLNTVTLLLKCLHLTESNLNKTALYTLCALLGCVDQCDGNQQLFKRNGGVRQLVDLLVTTQADGLKHLATLVLHCCVGTKEHQTHDITMETERGTSSSTVQQAKTTQTCLNEGISVGSQTSPVKVTDTHSKSTMTCQDLNITKKCGYQNASTQTGEVSATQQITEDACFPSNKAIHESRKSARRARMKFVPFVCKRTLWRSNQGEKRSQLKRQAKEPLPTRAVNMFYTADIHVPSASDSDCSDGWTQCAACGPHVNSRNLLDILVNGDVCGKHKKLGKLLMRRV